MDGRPWRQHAPCRIFADRGEDGGGGARAPGGGRVNGAGHERDLGGRDAPDPHGRGGDGRLEAGVAGEVGVVGARLRLDGMRGLDGTDGSGEQEKRGGRGESGGTLVISSSIGIRTPPPVLFLEPNRQEVQGGRGGLGGRSGLDERRQNPNIIDEESSNIIVPSSIGENTPPPAVIFGLERVPLIQDPPANVTVSAYSRMRTDLTLQLFARNSSDRTLRYIDQ